MKKIKLQSGKYTKVDDDNYEYLNQFKWRWRKLTNSLYVYRMYYIGNGKYKHESMHRIIMNAPKGMDVDHIDHNGLNNQKSNLRIVTRSQNMMNTKKIQKNKSSKYKGVVWFKPIKKWQVRIMINYKYISIGYFDSEDEAGLAYNKKAQELYGEYAYYNKIKKDGVK